MKQKLDVFLSRYSLSTHSIVAFCTVLVTMYYEVPTVHDYAYNTFTHLPPAVKNFIVVAITAGTWYYRGKKVWTPQERAEKTTTVVTSAPPGTSAGGDNAPVEVALTQEPESVPPPPPTPPAPASVVVPSPKPSTDGW